ncbi:hypothetical protein [Arthrobacter sp. G119Y2]|uniref:hypothetical protein n=1 Tax=Arthrobacter sp. G119Y2 TaxID=3134965 RepID=UPI0031197F5B
MSDNQAKFNEATDSVLPGKTGVRHDGSLFKQAKFANEAATAANKTAGELLGRFHPGKAGVRFEGDLYGILRRTEYNTAVTHQLVSALKAVSGGETFDEAKLLAGIEAAAKAGAEAGTAAAIKGIDTTVTFEQEADK